MERGVSAFRFHFLSILPQVPPYTLASSPHLMLLKGQVAPETGTLLFSLYLMQSKIIPKTCLESSESEFGPDCQGHSEYSGASANWIFWINEGQTGNFLFVSIFVIHICLKYISKKQIGNNLNVYQ